MKRLLILLLVISMVMTGCGKKEATTADGENDKPSQGKDQQELVYVKTGPITTKDFVNKLSLPGTVEPKETVIITAKVSGTVERIPVDVGSRVKLDGVLCELDDTEYKLQYDNAMIGLNKEKLTYESLQKNYERHKALFESQILSESEFENIENQYKLGKELLNLAENNYELAKRNLAYTHIKSPISGIISEKDVAMGENIGPGKMIFTVVSTDEVYVETGISEKDIPFAKVGQQVFIKVDSLGDTPFEGKINSIGPVPDGNTKAYPVKILIKNTENLLKTGMFANVEIILDNHRDVLAVSKEALFTEDDKTFVFVVKDGTAYKREVETGYSDDKAYEIISGIQQDEEVIVVGKDKVTDKSVVQVK